MTIKASNKCKVKIFKTMKNESKIFKDDKNETEALNKIIHKQIFQNVNKKQQKVFIGIFRHNL